MYSEQRVYGRDEKHEGVDNDLGQKFNENLRSHEINDKAKHLYERRVEAKEIKREQRNERTANKQ
jgi:hypothetical protein